MSQIASLLRRGLDARDDDAELAALRDDVATLCAKFTPYP